MFGLGDMLYGDDRNPAGPMKPPGFPDWMQRPPQERAEKQTPFTSFLAQYRQSRQPQAAPEIEMPSVSPKFGITGDQAVAIRNQAFNERKAAAELDMQNREALARQEAYDLEAQKAAFDMYQKMNPAPEWQHLGDSASGQNIFFNKHNPQETMTGPAWARPLEFQHLGAGHGIVKDPATGAVLESRHGGFGSYTDEQNAIRDQKWQAGMDLRQAAQADASAARWAGINLQGERLARDWYETMARGETIRDEAGNVYRVGHVMGPNGEPVPFYTKLPGDPLVTQQEVDARVTAAGMEMANAVQGLLGRHLPKKDADGNATRIPSFMTSDDAGRPVPMSSEQQLYVAAELLRDKPAALVELGDIADRWAEDAAMAPRRDAPLYDVLGQPKSIPSFSVPLPPNRPEGMSHAEAVGMYGPPDQPVQLYDGTTVIQKPDYEIVRDPWWFGQYGDSLKTIDPALYSLGMANIRDNADDDPNGKKARRGRSRAPFSPVQTQAPFINPSYGQYYIR